MHDGGGGAKRGRVEGKWVGCGWRQPERRVCSGVRGCVTRVGIVASVCKLRAEKCGRHGVCKTGWGGVCGRCAGVSLWSVCARTPALGRPCRGASRRVLRPIHHSERIEPGGYGGVTGASAPRSYPLHFRPSRARPRRLPEGSIHHRGRGRGGRGGGMQSRRADTREKHGTRRAQATRPRRPVRSAQRP